MRIYPAVVPIVLTMTVAVLSVAGEAPPLERAISPHQADVQRSGSVVLEGAGAKLVVNLAGGSIVDFHMAGHNLNPLTWTSAGTPGTPFPMGHFLCLDRWGQPSDAESKNGMPFHGEASSVNWQAMPAPENDGKRILAAMSANLPMAGISVKRTISLSATGAVFTVREAVTNTNKLGRVYNIVQHPTIAPPFLDEKTLVDSNAGKGFMQGSPLPNPEALSGVWPDVVFDGKRIDLRRLTTDHNPNVVSCIINGKYGWVTACSPTKGLMIGYIWKTADYPWFNAWRNAENGKPTARGLEFGTTGLHQPFPTLVKKGKIYGRPLYEYLDASETRSKSYACFLFKIPSDYNGVARLTYSAGRISLVERTSKAPRNLSAEVGDLFPTSD